MKRIFTFCMSLCFAQMMFGQSIIDSVTYNQILCNGDSTCITVYTTPSGAGNVAYTLQTENSFGGWWPTPITNIAGTAINTFCDITAGTKRIITEYPIGSGFTDTLEFTINQPDNITNATTSTNISCNLGNDGTISLTTFPGTPSFTYSLNGGPLVGYPGFPAIETITGLSAGTYNINIQDANGCTYNANPISVTLTEPAAPLTAITTPLDVLCNGGITGAIDVQGAGGTSPYRYRINGGAYSSPTNGVVTFSGLSAGLYTIDVLDANDCPFQITQSITEPTALIASASTNINCTGGNNASIDITASGGTASYTYSLNGGAWQNSSTFSSLGSGTYSVLVSDNNGCLFSINNIVIIQPQNSLSASANIDSVSCNGLSDGSITVSAANGIPSYTYSLNGGAPTSNSTFNNLLAGPYVIEIIDAINCTLQLPITIYQPNVLSIDSVTINNVNCNGGSDGSITLQSVSGGTPAYTYSLDGSPFSSISTFTSLDSGIYSLSVQDINLCTDLVSVTVGEPIDSVRVASITPQNTTCYLGSDGQITVVAAGGTAPYTFQINSSGYTSIPSGSHTFSNLSAGSYNIDIQDANNCIFSYPLSVDVNQPATPLILQMDSTIVTCFGYSDGEASVTVSGGVPFSNGYQYAWNTTPVVQTTATATGLSVGTYTVTVTDSAGCIAQNSVIVTEPQELVLIPLTAVEPSCHGYSDGNVTVSPTGGVTPYSYSWSTGDTTATASNLSANISYSVTVTDNVGCLSSTSITLNQPTLISVSTSLLTGVSCNGAADGSIDIDVNGGTPPYNYLWSTTDTTEDVSGLTAGTYTVTVTDAHGCTHFYTEVLLNPAALSASTNITHVACHGDSTGQVILTAIGGTPNFQFIWNTTPVQTTATATGLPAGVYICTITDGNGCVHPHQVTVNEPTPLVLTYNSTDASCNGICDGAASVIPSGGTSPYSYNWSNQAVTQTISSLCAGPYSVTVLDNLNCPAAAAMVVNEPNAIICTVTSTDASCNGGEDGTLTATASGGTATNFSYNWSNGAVDPFNPGLSAGTAYYVDITDNGNGCIQTFGPFFVNQPTAINISLSATTQNIIFGSSSGAISASVSGGTPNYTYLWTSPNGFSSSTQNINSLTEGIYTLCVTDANNCTECVSSVVNHDTCSVMIDTVITQPLCHGDLGTISWTNSGGVPPYDNILMNSNGDTLIDTQNPATSYTYPSGVYDLHVYDATGICFDIWNIDIVDPDPLSLTLTTTDVSCNGGSDGTASAIVSGGTGSVTIDWGMVNPNSLSEGMYSVTLIDANNCSLIDTFYIFEPSALVIDSLTTTSVSCVPPNGDGSITIYPSGGASSSYDYTINNFSTIQSSNTFSNLSTGTYTVQIRDVNGCIKDTIITINSIPSLNVSIISTPISCNGANDASLSAIVTGGTQPYNYAWTNPPSPVVMSVNSAIYNLSPGAYQLTVTDANGCNPSSSSIVSTVSTPPVLSTVALTTTAVTLNGACDGQILWNGVSPGGVAPHTYSWTGPGGFVVSNASTPALTGGTLCAGQYNLTIVDANGCNSFQSISVMQPACSVWLNPSITQPTCFNTTGSISWTAGGGSPSYTSVITNLSTNTYVLSPSTQVIPTWVNFPLTDGTYYLSVSDNFGCTAGFTFTIQAPDALTFNIDTTNLTCNYVNGGSSNGQVQVTVNGGTQPYYYDWGNGYVLSSINAGLDTGWHYLSVTDANGCGTTPSSIPPVGYPYYIGQPDSMSSILASTDISCHLGNDGTASVVSVSGGSLPYAYSWIPGSSTSSNTTSTINSLGVGTQFLVITDANGCTSNNNVTINQPSAPLSVNIISNDISCYGASDGDASVTASGGTSPYSFVWTPTGSINPSIFNLDAGTYSCQVTDINGCVNSNITTINQPTQIQDNLISTDVSCNGDADGGAVVNPSGGSGAPYSVQWYDGTTGWSISGLLIGTYYVDITDNSGCTSRAWFTINQPDILLATASVSQHVSCFSGVNSSNGIITVAVNGGNSPFTYNWTDGTGATVSLNATATALPAGTYTVLVTDSKGCTTSSSGIITSPTQITPAYTSTDVSCFGGNDGTATVSALGGTAPYTYQWTPNGSTSNFADSLSASSIQYVVVTDANGCLPIMPLPVIINEPNLLVVNVIPVDVTCFGVADGMAAGVVTGGTPGFSYLWNTGQTTQSITPLDTGTYSCVVTDANGCVSAPNSGTINQPTEVVPNFSINNVSCNGLSDGSVTITPSGGDGGPYTIYDANGGILQVTNFFTPGITLSSLSAGLDSIYIEDDNNCNSGFLSYTITQPDTLLATASVLQHVSCSVNNNTSDGEVTVAVSGGTAPYTYSWDDANNSTTDTVDSLPVGSYIVTITDINGCATSDTTTLTSPSSITATFTTTEVSCYGGNNGSATVTAAGGTSPYTYLWNSNSDTTANSGGFSYGSEIVTITDALGCNFDATVMISQADPILVTAAITDVSCNGLSDGVILIAVTGGTAPYSYSWDNGQLSQNCTTLVAGTYTVTVTDAKGCTADSSFIVSELTALTANITALSQISCNGWSDGSLTVSASGGTGTYTYNWNTGSTQMNILNIPSGNYNVTVQDSNGCSVTESIIFNEPDPISISFTTSDYNGHNISCNGLNDGSIIANVSGGVGINPTTLNWSSGQTGVNSISSLLAGTYQLTVADNNGCVATDSITLTEPASLSYTLTSTQTVCYGDANGTATITTTGGTPSYSYVWDDILVQTNSTAVGLSAGTYTCIVTDINMCADTMSVTVNDATQISINFTINSNYMGYDVSCAGASDGEVTVTATGGTNTYQYSEDSVFFSFNNTFNNLSEGTFVAYVRDANNCVAQNSIILNAPDSLDANITELNSIVCFGDTNGELAAIPIGGQGSFSYSWTGPNGYTGSTDLISSLVEGQYTVTVTDLNGCQDVQSYNLTPLNTIIPHFTTTQVTCTGTNTGTAIVNSTGGTAPYSYLWNTTALTDTLIGLGAGTYWVFITDANGCVDSSGVVITEAPNVLTIDSVITNDVLCFGDNTGSASITSVLHGTAPYYFEWRDASNTLLSTTPTATDLVIGNYTCSVTDSSHCTVQHTVTINQPNPLLSNITSTNVSCFGFSDGMINTNASGGIAPYTYSWNDANGFNATTNNVSNLDPGTYWVFITDANGCIDSSGSVITEPTPLNYTVSTIDPKCHNDNDGSIILAVSGGISPYTYSLNGGTPQSTPPFDNLVAGNYTVTVIDANGCLNTSSANLINPPLLTIDTHNETMPTCFGYVDGSASFTAVGGYIPYTYIVKDENGNLVNNPNSLSSGNYMYLVQDYNGCKDSLSFTILERPEIEITLDSIKHVDCYGESTGGISVDVSNTQGNYQVIWNPSNIDSLQLYNLSSGTYQITIIDDNFCVKVDSFSVSETEPIVIDFTTYDVSCNGLSDGRIDINSITGGTIPYDIYMDNELVASNESMSILIDSLVSGTYSITILDANTCSISSTASLEIIGGFDCVSPPVILSPNFDGVNDTWEPVLDLDTDIEVTILNRWGNVEFYYSGYALAFSWDGKSTDGKDLPSYDYYYIIKFNNITYPDKTGVITLIR